MANKPLPGMTRPEMVLFDYGHTLLYEPDWDSERGDRALLEFAVKNPKGCTVEDIRMEVKRVFGDIERVRSEMGYDIPCTTGNRLVYDHLGIELSLTPQEIENVFWTAACPGAVMPGADSLIRYLNETGIRTGVISNNGWSGKALGDRFARLLPENGFEFVLSSADYMIRKPDPRLFEIALLKAGLSPERVWFVGDSYGSDIVGAHNAGIFPVWYEEETVERSPSNPAEAEEPSGFPCLHIRSLRELTDILEDMTQKRD